jgi:hypothetical protein
MSITVNIMNKIHKILVKKKEDKTFSCFGISKKEDSLGFSCSMYRDTNDEIKIKGIDKRLMNFDRNKTKRKEPFLNSPK